MLTSIQLRNYRSFQEFAVEDLTRISLLVGKNNCGKTSIIEAAEVVASGGTPAALLRSLSRRAERIPESEDERRPPELDVCHLFFGHRIDVGAALAVSGRNDLSIEVRCEVVLISDQPNLPFPEPSEIVKSDDDWIDVFLEPQVGLRISHGGNGKSITLPLSAMGGLPSAAIWRSTVNEPVSIAPTVLVIPTEGLDTRSLGRLWNSIALTPDENLVLEALRIIEPDLERLAYLATERRTAARGVEGFFVTFLKQPDRIPFGSMGDGLKRLLAMAMAVTRAAGGYLLIDEIDTGLHYSTMPAMWRLIVETARRLNVQVIATTHSLDCVESLASLHRADADLAADISLHQIEKAARCSMPFSAHDLAIGIRHRMEFRG